MKRDSQLLLYMHRGRVQTEVVGMWDASRRATTLRGCCAAIIYRFVPDNGEIHEWVYDAYWTANYSVPVPEEIRLAAMLVN